MSKHYKCLRPRKTQNRIKLDTILFSFQDISLLYHSPISAALYDKNFVEFHQEMTSTKISFRRLSKQHVLFGTVKCVGMKTHN